MRYLILTPLFILWCLVAKSQTSDTTRRKVFFEPEESAPEFTGGSAALTKYLSTNIHYPKIALKNNIQGKVILIFIVEINGKLTDIQVARHVSPEIDLEAVRVISMMPKWKAGTQNNHPLRIRYTLPINFSIPSKKS